MAPVDLTKDTLDAVLDGNDIVFLDFWAVWCGPCRAFAPVYARVAAKHPDIVFGRVNTDTQREISRDFQISSIPTLIACREGIFVFIQPGALGLAQMEKVISHVRGLDMNKVRNDLDDGVGPDRTDGAVV